MLNTTNYFAQSIRISFLIPILYCKSSRPWFTQQSSFHKQRCGFVRHGKQINIRMTGGVFDNTYRTLRAHYAHGGVHGGLIEIGCLRNCQCGRVFVRIEKRIFQQPQVFFDLAFALLRHSRCLLLMLACVDKYVTKVEQNSSKLIKATHFQFVEKQLVVWQMRAQRVQHFAVFQGSMLLRFVVLWHINAAQRSQFLLNHTRNAMQKPSVSELTKQRLKATASKSNRRKLTCL